jgi:DNA-directed RNA polymerase subunit RPC12/RpoP
MIKALKNTIPKKQYLTDIECIRHIKKMIDAKVSVLIFPEGRESIDGNFQGFTDALGKLIKWLRVPVVSIHSPGCFLTRPRWLPGFRIGRIETEVKILLNADEVDTLTAEEINSRVRAAIDYNDFDWQARNKVEFKSKEFKRAESLFRILYKCPACGAEYKNISDGDELRCTECGNRVVVGPYGEMTALDGGVSLPRIDKWYRYQQDMLLEEIKRKGQDYSISTEVKRAEYDWDKLKFVYKESGVLTLTLVGFEFVGDTRKIQFVRPNNPPAIHSDLYFEKIILFLEDDPHEFTCTGYERPAKFNQVVQAMSSAFPTELRKKQPQST